MGIYYFFEIVMKIYLVGGAVRDQLLGLIPKDRDYVVVGSSPNEMLKKGGGISYRRDGGLVWKRKCFALESTLLYVYYR